MRNRGWPERDPKYRDSRVENRERERPNERKGKGKWRQGEGKLKSEGRMSDEETIGNERLDKRQWSLEQFGIERQRFDWVGEQTRDDQTFIFAITDTRPTITELHMRNSILSAFQPNNRPIVGCVVSICPKTFSSEVQKVGAEQKLQFFIVLGEPLRHDGTR